MSVPDHGDIPALACQIEQPSPDSLRTTTHGRCAPYSFSRTLILKENRLRAEYEIINTGTTNLPWTWFVHPLLKLEPGMQLIADVATPFEVVFAAESSPHSMGDPFVWPGVITLPDMEASDFEGYAFKLSSEYKQCDHFACRTADGSETLRFEWNADQLPHLALWLNCGGWHGMGDQPYFNLGLEPAKGPDDDLADALKNNRAQWLAPANTARWSFDIILEKGNDHDD